MIWEELFTEYFLKHANDDASHDIGHFRRVYSVATQIAEDEPVDHLVILAAAYFHDIVSLPKDHLERAVSSRHAAIKAREVLKQMNFPEEKLDAVCHAIESHSFTSQIEPETLEAKIIQDADRMEALGAIGAMRAFYISGRLGSLPFDPEDLYASRRPLDDKKFALDHFYVKLFKLPALLKTEGGKRFAEERVEFLKAIIKELELNVVQGSGGALFLVDACYEAGKSGSKLWDASDCVITRLIAAEKDYPEFLGAFLSHFQSEINPSHATLISASL